ncbi:MAG: aldo/keto reductase [Anaerotignum sp.]|nr:aldo/keto reductase [Anaerotignum sp.]
MRSSQLTISRVGFGTARLPGDNVDNKWILNKRLVEKMIREAYDLGINYFDSGELYCRGQSEYVISEYLKPIRENVYLSNKVKISNFNKKGLVINHIENSLKKLGQDYFDFYYFWGINKDEFDNAIKKHGYLEEMLLAKRRGLINNIGFSFHDAPEAMRYIINGGEHVFDAVLCKYNIIDQTNEREIEYAHRKGLKVLTMSPLAGGKISADGKKIPIDLSLKFALSNEKIDCVLIGFSNDEMIKHDIALLNNMGKITQLELEEINRILCDLKSFSDLYCTGCDYCQPCPQKIPISRYFNDYNLIKVHCLTKPAIDDYTYLSNAEFGTVNHCIHCLMCKDKCPQKLDIPTLLLKADRFLKKTKRFYAMLKENEDSAI